MEDISTSQVPYWQASFGPYRPWGGSWPNASQAYDTSESDRRTGFSGFPSSFETTLNNGGTPSISTTTASHNNVDHSNGFSVEDPRRPHEGPQQHDKDSRLSPHAGDGSEGPAARPRAVTEKLLRAPDGDSDSEEPTTKTPAFPPSSSSWNRMEPSWTEEENRKWREDQASFRQNEATGRK